MTSNNKASKLQTNSFGLKKSNIFKFGYLKRKEYVLKIVITGSIFLTTILFLFKALLILYFKLNNLSYNGDSVLNILIVTTILLILLELTRRGKGIIAALLLVSTFFLAGVYTSISWGTDVPQAILIYSITIVLSGILVNSIFAFVVTFIISITLIILGHLQGTAILEYNDYWLSNPPGLVDGISISISLFIITIVTWLSNRELENSLRRAEESERALKKERDLLETRVEERTEELKRMQLEKMAQLYRFADFGWLASGLMHDLVNPLTSVSLNISQLASNKTKVSKTIKRAQNGIQRMEEYVQAARKQIQQQEIHKVFSIRQEIEQVVKIFSYRQKKEHVEIKISVKGKVETYGNVIAFNQVLTNIVANAFDALEQSTKRQKKITITGTKKGKNITVSIHDNGPGISTKDMKHVFEPFFTTKAEKGTGIGLSISKKAIQDSLYGTITVSSTKKDGTTFTLEFPHRVAANPAVSRRRTIGKN